MKPSSRADIPPFIAMDVMAKARARGDAGHEILHLEVGEPGTPLPKAAADAVNAHLLSRKPVSYTVASGLPELRMKIVRHYQKDYGIDIDPRRIILTNGASGGFALTYLSAFDVGDTIAIQNPGYPAYRNTALALGLKTALVETTLEDRFQPTRDTLSKVHQKTPLKGLILASPSNPTGTIIPQEQFQGVADFCQQEGIILISDEIYHGLHYTDRPAETALSFKDTDVIVINSFSKYYSMTGWRIGWLVVPENMVDCIIRLQQNFNICVPYLSQIAAIAALDAKEDLEIIKQGYAKNKQALEAALPELGFDHISPADGAFYIYAELPKSTQETSSQLAERLLSKYNIAATPGADFDPIHGDKWIRFSYAGTYETITKAIDSLKNNPLF